MRRNIMIRNKIHAKSKMYGIVSMQFVLYSVFLYFFKKIATFCAQFTLVIFLQNVKGFFLMEKMSKLIDGKLANCLSLPMRLDWS